MKLLYSLSGDCFLAETPFGYVLYDEDEAACRKDYHLTYTKVFLQGDSTFYVTGEQRKFQFFWRPGYLDDVELYVDSENIHKVGDKFDITAPCWLELKERTPFCLRTKNLSFLGERFLNEISEKFYDERN